jgi:hypothetical protein
MWRIRIVCWMIKATCTYAHARAHAPGYPKVRTLAHACRHRPISNACCFFAVPRHNDWRMRLSVKRYTYIVPLTYLHQYSSRREVIVSQFFVISNFFNLRSVHSRFFFFFVLPSSSATHVSCFSHSLFLFLLHLLLLLSLCSLFFNVHINKIACFEA